MKLPISSEMDCRHASDLLSQYADGDLPAHRRAQVQAHLDGCPTCATRLQTLREAVSFLEADAKTPLPAMPDLYAGFRERLVTQPSGSSPLAQRAQRAGGAWHIVRMGMAGVALVAAASMSILWHRRAAVLNEAIHSLRLPNNGSTFMRYTRQGSEVSFTSNTPQGSKTVYVQVHRQSDTLWKDGYRWSCATISNSKHLYRETALTTPGGVGMGWRTSLDGAKTLPIVHFNWNPADPSRPQNTELQYLFEMFRHWLKQVSHSRKMLFADIETAQETIGGERMNKLTIRRLNTAMDAQPMPNGEYFEPYTLVLWFDANKRLRQYREEFHVCDGSERSEQETIAYDQKSPIDIANYPLPKDWPVVVSMGGSSQSILVAGVITPLWRTMSEAEKQQLQSVADRFARAWVSRDTAQLRSLVDLNRPLEVTAPAKHTIHKTVTQSGGLSSPQSTVSRVEEVTAEDIWQHVWAERLAKEPLRPQYRLLAVYAYEANHLPMLNVSPLAIQSGSIDHPLPGLNMLVWVTETSPLGGQTNYAARLFLVKRGKEWKVWQFAREAARPNTGGWDEGE